MLLLTNELEKAMNQKEIVEKMGNGLEELSLDSFVYQQGLLENLVKKLNNHEYIQYHFMATDTNSAFKAFIESEKRYDVLKIEKLNDYDWFLRKVLVFDSHKDEYVVYLYNAMSGFSEGDYFEGSESGYMNAIESYKNKL